MYYKDYCIDTLGCKDIDLTKSVTSIEHWKVPTYERVQCEYIIGEEAEEMDVIQDAPAPAPGQPLCFNCNEPGHGVSLCPKVYIIFPMKYVTSFL